MQKPMKLDDFYFNEHILILVYHVTN